MAFATNLTFAAELGFEVVDLFVGKDKKRYVVHKNLLTAQSDYFSKALTGSFMEAEEKAIYLKDEDPAAVALLVAWLYLGVIPGTKTNTSNSDAMSVFSRTQTTTTTTVQIPLSKTGTAYAFYPSMLPAHFGSSGDHDLMEHVCGQNDYNIFSPEELRLADYELKVRYQSDRSPPIPANPPGFSFPPYVPRPPTNLFSRSASNSPTPSSPGSDNQPSTYHPSGFSSTFDVPAAQSSSNVPAAVTPVGQVQGLFGGTNSSAAGAAPVGQTQSLFGGVSNSAAGAAPVGQGQSLFGGMNNSAAGAAPVGQTKSLFGGANSSTAGGISGGTFPGSANLFQHYNSRPASVSGSLPTPSTHSQPQTGGLFRNLLSQAQAPGQLGSATYSSSHSAGVSGLPRQPQTGFGIFGLNPHQSQVDPTSSSAPLAVPRGAVMTTITHQKPKPGEFGYHELIKLLPSPGCFIPGIPRADPRIEQFFDIEKHQLALLNLTIMAETFCWTKLFNASINAFIRGEHRLQRPLSLDYIDRIYERTHEDSTLRVYVLESLAQMKLEGIEDLTPYMNMATKHSDFLADLLGKIMGSISPKDVTEKTIQTYMLGMESQEGHSR